MAFFQAILLAIIQGLTEFLPVSSSGHLVAAQHFLKHVQEPDLFFELLLHLATLLAVCLFFRRDLRTIATGWRTRGASMEPSEFSGHEGRAIRLMLYASIPTAVLGLFGRRFVVTLFENASVAAGMMLITGIILFLSRYARRAHKDIRAMSWRHAVMIGVAQGVAIVPGISRSGVTITAALFCGLRPELAVRFSFLLSIPAILGASLIEGARLLRSETLPDLPLGPGLVAFPIAAAVGYLSLHLLLRALFQWRFHLFAYYCWVVGGGVILAVLFFG